MDKILHSQQLISRLKNKILYNYNKLSDFFIDYDHLHGICILFFVSAVVPCCHWDLNQDSTRGESK
jgi:hypothetical protein